MTALARTRGMSRSRPSRSRLCLVGRRVFPRRRVHPHLAVASLRGEGADVVGPEVEGAAGGQVEAGVVPVTGQDTVLDGAPVQGEAHVGAAVVNGMDLIAPGEECQGVSLDVDGQAACGLDVCQAANANEVSASAVFLGHDRFSLSPEAEAMPPPTSSGRQGGRREDSLPTGLPHHNASRGRGLPLRESSAGILHGVFYTGSAVHARGSLWPITPFPSFDLTTSSTIALTYASISV